MNCTVCGKDVNDHNEGRNCDRCIAEKLGLNITLYTPTGDFYLDTAECCEPIPHYSSPEMSAETWGLVEKMKEYFQERIADRWDTCSIDITWHGDKYFCKGNRADGWPNWSISTPTPTLAICRAFLAMEKE